MSPITRSDGRTYNSVDEWAEELGIHMPWYYGIERRWFGLRMALRALVCRLRGSHVPERWGPTTVLCRRCAEYLGT